ncbi:unnamed protein product [Lactuca virosa]|uniref:SBP-type domain-containing protein n=1 Tax=Lactuca virosa TaxID=75947 RepID=A0AAU9LSD4_9ASTR|nr:unnamed protein product [Lactuca virosa]
MEWNTKWDWENHEIFSSKVMASPKKLQTNYEEELDGSFNLSGVVGGSGGSASDMGNSSISASTESSFKDGNGNGNGIGIRVSKFPFQGFAGFPNSSKKEFESPPPSVSSGEPFIGLKLGKRTYFENNNSKTSSFSDIPISSVSTVKKVKSSSYSQTTPTPRCQVEGCNLDLSSAKEYHRKHRVCESHSKSPKVVVGTLERRFCQQCSRFHGLSEFDERKRSCRRRLSDHNARRRKPQQETIQFNSTNMSSSFYGGRQNLSFVLNNGGPLVQSRPPAVSSTWENSSVNMPTTIGFNRSVPLKATRVEALDQGFKESLSPPNVDALDIRRALSLLSNNTWGVYESDLVAVEQHHNHNHNHNGNPIQHGMQSVPQLPPVEEYWRQPEPPIDAAAKTSNSISTTQFQDFQLFNRFYSNPIPMDEIYDDSSISKFKLV